ncbi:MAG TPA: hypothetical protein VLW65_20655 [Bryobacteraceae bacterium]|nr:hypothetical protein [Bryobacteraceae bacterium]
MQEKAFSEVRCLRCLQPFPENARRCPNCRTPRPGGRGFPLFLGVASLAALIFLVFMMVKTMWNEESPADDSTPAAQSDQAPPLNK